MKNVMLIHGFNGVPKIYTYFKEKLEEEGYNIIIPEFPTKTNITIDGFFKVFDKYTKLYLVVCCCNCNCSFNRKCNVYKIY